MPRPPSGLATEEYPLKHRFTYSFGLSAATATMNSAWVTLVRNDKLCTSANAKTILVNQHNSSVDMETGPVCTPMSIIQNLKVISSASKSSANDTNDAIKASWTPFFCSFPEKYDAADDHTGTSVAAIMQLTKDATNEDIVPLTTNKLPVDGLGERDQPLSTVNLAEAFDTHYNMTTDDSMEDTPFDSDAFYNLLQHGTNKGALKACLGRTRRFSLVHGGGPRGQRVKTWYIKKFVPRAIRRIVPFTFFGLLFHMPLESDRESYYNDTNFTASKSHIGFKVHVTYDEWNDLHDNTRS